MTAKSRQSNVRIPGSGRWIEMSCTTGIAVATITDRTPENERPDSTSVNDRLLLAIFWDGNLFNKIQELGGTAIGFSQMRCRMLESLVLAHHRTNA
jgi:hypothetical protein